ncbi:MAG: NAD(P)H-dependent oxidoreductase [Spirochaetales bacterium]|nr:NAD(P)H-dependent oxidoreductase [Spirochaetales bacterium]
MNKKILVINANPDRESLCSGLALRYKLGADSVDADCQLVNLIDMKFDPVLHYGYRKPMAVEDDILRLQALVDAADHIVFVYPVWWGTYPALLKGFIDRVIFPNFAFRYRPGKSLPEQLLKGKSARLIITMNTPKFYHRLVYKNASIISIKRCVLGFCGVKPVSTTVFTPVRKADAKKIESWMAKVEILGMDMK